MGTSWPSRLSEPLYRKKLCKNRKQEPRSLQRGGGLWWRAKQGRVDWNDVSWTGLTWNERCKLSRQHCISSNHIFRHVLLTWCTFRNTFQGKRKLTALLATHFYGMLPNVCNLKAGLAGGEPTTTEISSHWAHDTEMLTLIHLSCINSAFCYIKSYPCVS